MSDELDGFEYKGRFYQWSVTDLGKDLMLIDRIAQMSPSAFMEMISDADENERTPVILALVATSLRLGHPDWSVDRIYRTVMGLSLGEDISFVSSGAAEEDEASPPAEAAGPPPSEAGRSPSNGSSPPSTPEEASSSATSSAIPR
jgi:hypothetical protein